jgi:hypothetical protein
MSPSVLKTLRSGQQYRVKIRNQRTATRIFLYRERRFKHIPCAVFSSPVRGPLIVHLDKPGQIRIAGPKPPRSALSVPHYDLLECEPIPTCSKKHSPGML